MPILFDEIYSQISTQEITVIEPSFEILSDISESDMLFLELCARNAYKSEHRIATDSYKPFLKRLIKMGHESVLEHKTISVRFILSRAATHQLVRHRLGSYTQSSQRYITLKTDLKVIKPHTVKDDNYLIWLEALSISFNYYKILLQKGLKAEDARSLLPNATASDIVVTYNLRQWRTFFKIRTAPHAQEEIRSVSRNLLLEFKKLMPEIFNDLLVP